VKWYCHRCKRNLAWKNCSFSRMGHLHIMRL